MSHEWKIRSMDEADSAAASSAAKNMKMTTAAWVGEAIREKVARQREPVQGEVMAQPASPEPVPPFQLPSIDAAFRHTFR